MFRGEIGAEGVEWLRWLEGKRSGVRILDERVPAMGAGSRKPFRPLWEDRILVWCLRYAKTESPNSK